MSAMSTAQALVFIAKALINIFLYLTQKIKRDEFEKRISEMDKLINKASSGPLETRVEAGQEIEDRINNRARP